MAAERVSARVRKRGAACGSQAAHAGAEGSVSEARSIVGLQRSRLLSAAIGVLAEQGHAGFSAAAVCERAGVSRRTFYEVFENGEQCVAEILVEAERQTLSVLAGLGLDRLAWDERVRVGLWALLCLVDENPALARACLVESQHAGGVVQVERERIVAALVDVLDQGRAQSTGVPTASRLTAEALVGAVSSVISTRLSQAPLDRGGISGGNVDRGRVGGDRVGGASVSGGAGVRGLLGELTGMIVLPYLGPAAARRQIRRDPPEVPVLVLKGMAVSAWGPDPLASLPMRLTYRTARVLQAVAKLTRTGAGASNREIAEAAGVDDAGQISKLLGRLAQRGLLENSAAGSRERGEANQWLLTQTGQRVVQSIGAAHAVQLDRAPSWSAA